MLIHNPVEGNAFWLQRFIARFERTERFFLPLSYEIEAVYIPSIISR